MSFGGGGGGQLTAHTHDPAIPLDGGSLAANATSFSLNAGSILYSDGVNIEELASPLTPAGETLTFAPAATAPSWGTSGGDLITITKSYTDVSGGELDIYTLPIGASLNNVFVNTTTTFSNSNAVTVGDSADPNGWVDTTDLTAAGLVTGTKGVYTTGWNGLRSTTGTTALKAYNFALGNVSTASYVSTFSVAAQNASPGGLCFNTTGSKMYIACFDAPFEVNEYDLGTPYDITTASFLQRFATVGRVAGVVFNTTGSNMYTADMNGSDIDEFACSTPFDVTTASLTTSFSVNAQEPQPLGLRFNTTGSKMYVIGQVSNAVFEYDLGTPFDISTASYSGSSLSVAGQELGSRDLVFNSAGNIVLIVGVQTDTVYQYNLTTAFDVSTGSYSGNSFGVSGQDLDPTGIELNADNTKLYITGEQNSSVYEYTVGLGALDTQGIVEFYLQVMS